jgi:hypothetical protein
VKSGVVVVIVKFSSSSSSSFGEFGCEKSCAVLKKKLLLVFGWFVCLLGSYLNPNRFLKACSSSSSKK